MSEWRFPWPKPTSAYDSCGPREPGRHEFALDGVRFAVEATGQTGVTTGRDRYRVECVDCDVVLHEATTGPDSRIEDHLREHR